MSTAVTWRARWELEFAPRWRVLDGSHQGCAVPLYVPASRVVPPGSSPRPLPDSNESVKTIRALEEQIRGQKETP